MDVAVVGADDETFLLELLNTTPVVDGVRHDVLDAAWLAARGIAHSDRDDVIAVRNVLQGVVRGTQAPSVLGPFLGATTLRPEATAGGVRWRLAVDGVAESAVRAVLAWDALRINSPGRLRPCANDACQLFLIDRSKPNSARWCSMAICGNRMKARRHYRRAKSGE